MSKPLPVYRDMAHAVKQGDSYAMVARRYGVSKSTVARAWLKYVEWCMSEDKEPNRDA